jgi:nucleoside-diphosphate-sugar epimerase
VKIFVTGATGFIGQAFCRVALMRGHQLLALSRNPSPSLPSEVQLTNGDLANTPWHQVAKFAPDAALHLAWTAEPGVYLHSPENEVWLSQSKAWFQKIFELKVPYVAGAGTCIEYSPSPNALVEDTSPLDPQFPYSKAKFQLFEWLHANALEDWAWFRIFYPYGPGEHPKRLCTSLVRQFKKAEPVSLKTPDSIKDYIFIDDVALGLCFAIERKLKGPMNIGSEVGVSIRDLCLQIAHILETDPGLVQNAPELLHDPSPVTVADTHRLRNSGWMPTVNLELGLRRLIDSLHPFHT